MKKKIIKITKKTLKMILYTILILIVGITLFINLHPTFGDSPKQDSLDKMKLSQNYDGKKFHNLVSTKMMTNSSNNDTSIMGYFIPPKDKNPQKPLPSLKFEKENIKEDSFTWLGHSTILMRTSNITIITDPLFNRASPIPIGGKAFDIENPVSIQDLPKIDVVVISHDHYDHLDYKAIKEINQKVDMFYVPLGVKAHLEKWGVEKNKIQEFDWYENMSYKQVNFTFAPSRHFSGRGITNRDSTLWGSWIIKSQTQNIYFSGDSGYYDEFKKIGNEYGPFDISFVECGAYNEGWSQIHMMPEESVQVSIDLKSKVFFPIHWSKFDLAQHNWDEPAIRATNEAKKKNVTYTTPLIGETFTLNNLPQEHWWEELRN